MTIMNYFDLLNIDSSFALDLSVLESAYFKAQRQYHPDRFVGKPEAERLAAMQRSLDSNKAYHILKDPLKRAQYLLHLQGIEVGTDHDTVKPSQELLMEVMELRETLPKTVAPLVEESINRIGKLFEIKDFSAMAQEVLRLGYLVKA